MGEAEHSASSLSSTQACNGKGAAAQRNERTLKSLKNDFKNVGRRHDAPSLPRPRSITKGLLTGKGRERTVFSHIGNACMMQ